MEKSQPLTITNDPDPAPPSYSESPNPTLGLAPDQKTQSLPLHVHLAESRSLRVNLIVKTYIEPLLLTQASSGLFKTTFLLVPSNVSALQHPNATPEDIVEGTGTAHNNGHQDEIVGFPASEYVKLVRLHGEEHTSEFWRQPAVLAELHSSLEARLANSGHRISQPAPITLPNELARSPAPASPTKGKKSSFWSRKGSKSASTSNAAVEEDVTRDMKLGWRADGDGNASPGMGETRVTVGLREVCLRVVTEMGLFETRTGQAVGITVEVGG
jgi:hypothetical protein